MNLRHRRTRAAVAISAAALVAGPITAISAHAVSRPVRSVAALSTGPTSGLLPESKILLSSASHVDLHNDTVRFPLHRKEFQGKTYWYILTEASDFGLAHDLNVNYAPKLANVGISCAVCVQNVTLTGAADNKFGEALLHVVGVGLGQFSEASVDILFVRGFDAGQPIIYISTELSDPVASVLERATFVPALQGLSFLGGDDFLGSARERIFPFVNGRTG